MIMQLSQIYFSKLEEKAPNNKPNLDVNAQIQKHLKSVRPTQFHLCMFLITALIEIFIEDHFNCRQ